MAKNVFDDDEIFDNDPTDELPILTDVILAGDSEQTASMPAAEDETGSLPAPEGPPSTDALPDDRAAALERDLGDRDAKLVALEAELGRLELRWRETAAELEQLRDTLASRETDLARAAEADERARAEILARDARIAALSGELDSAGTRGAALADEAERLGQRIAELEAAQPVASRDAEPPDGPAAGLREEIAALSQHIENRNAVWRAQAAAVAAGATRIRELELELAQRAERQQAAEQHAEAEAERAHALGEKLDAATEALKRMQPEPDVGGDAQDGAALSDGPARLRRELARAVALQAQAAENPEGLRRLEELETAIRDLEQQMDAAESAAPRRAPETRVARLVCLTGESLDSYALDRPSVVIGRGPQCEIQIMTHYVSREHARVAVTSDGCVIEDLGSRNGVFVNSVRVQRQLLSNNDFITIGDTQFRFHAW